MRESARKHNISFSERRRERKRTSQRESVRSISRQTGNGCGGGKGREQSERSCCSCCWLSLWIAFCVFVRYARGKISDLSADTAAAAAYDVWLCCAARSFIKVTTNFETQPEHRLRPSTSTATSTSTSPSPSLTTESRFMLYCCS